MSENSQAAIKLEQAKQWLLQAGQFLRENLTEPLEITEKTRRDDLVTNFDHAVQDRICQQIQTLYPDDQILAEEETKETENEGKPAAKTKFSKTLPALWVLDPIDGTTNFIVQKDKFAIMLAYFEYGVGQFGLILDVMQEKLYWCDDVAAYCMEHDKKNPQTFVNRQLSANPAELSESLLGVNAYMYRTNTGGLLDLSFQTLGVRCNGSAGISYVDLLEGRLIGYFSNLQPWDYAAGAMIAERIGFTTRAIAGGRPHYKGREMIYTVPARLLNDVRRFLV